MSVYCCSDLHGKFNLWKQIKEFLKPDDKLIFLGDAADRGPDGWKIIKEMLSDPRVTYVLGNHDDMLLRRWFDKDDIDTIRAHISNGGEPTWDAVMNDAYASVYLDKLRHCHYHIFYTNSDRINILLTHSGSDKLNDHEDLLWNRDHYKQTKMKTPNVDLIIHGHTPIPFLQDDIYWPAEWKEGSFWYCDNQKVDIDCAAFWSGHTTLLNLDTFDEHIFYEEENDEL